MGSILTVLLFLTVLAQINCACTDCEIQEECKKEAGFEGSLGTINNEGAPKEAKCFLRCMMTKKGVLIKDGKIDKASAKAVVLREYPDQKEKVFKVIDECISKVKPNPDDLCEMAYEYVVCRRSKLGVQSA